MTVISISIEINDIARETNNPDRIAELLNEWGRLEDGKPTRIIDIDELDAYGVSIIDELHRALEARRAKGWTP